MASRVQSKTESRELSSSVVAPQFFELGDAEEVLQSLAGRYPRDPPRSGDPHGETGDVSSPASEASLPILEARYRTLLEQMSAIVFMAYLDRGIGEAYVSPQIEATLGFSQQEWLEDPVRWYAQIHPDEKQRWSIEAAHMLLTGEPLRSIYRVLARDGHVVWFHCEARIVRRADGSTTRARSTRNLHNQCHRNAGRSECKIYCNSPDFRHRHWRNPRLGKIC